MGSLQPIFQMVLYWNLWGTKMIRQYEIYVQVELALGGTPKTFDEWILL